MTDVETIRIYLRVCMIVAAISATLFPILYSTSKWYASWLGRTLMLQAVAMATGLDLAVISRYWKPGEFVIVTVYAFVFTFLACTTAALTFQMWIHNHPSKKSKYKQKETFVSENNPESLEVTYPLLSDRNYEQLKNFVTLVLPAIGALYFGLASYWGLPKPEEVVGSVALVATFLGVCLKLAERSYDKSEEKYDGVIDVATREDGTKSADLVLKNYENPADVVAQKEVLFKVNESE